MKISIRKARTEDWKAIRKVAQTVFAANKKYDLDLNMKWPYSMAGVRYYKSVASSRKGCKLVAGVDGGVVGYLIGGKFAYNYRKVTYGEIRDMGILPHYRHKGVGTKLVDEFRKWCRARRYRKLYVNTYYDDPRAVNFYKKQDMIPIDLILIGRV